MVDSGWSEATESFETMIADKTALRLQRKLLRGEEYLDLRKWIVDEKKNEYFVTGKGLCMKPLQWAKALKLFYDNKLPFETELDSKSNGQIGSQ